MFSKPNYKCISNNNQTRSSASRLKNRVSLLKQGCRGWVAHRSVVYLATPIDQFHNPNYCKVRDLIGMYFKPREWVIFEPARCDWTTQTWLKVWPRLVRRINALVIWPRVDGSVGLGVFKEACDVQSLGKPVYVLGTNARLKMFNGFKLYNKQISTHYARVRFCQQIAAFNTSTESDQP